MKKKSVRFYILTAVLLRIQLFWDVTLRRWILLNSP